MMKRQITAALVGLAVLTPVILLAQDGPAQRVGRALENAGRNVRRTVENGIARGEIANQERDVLSRVYHRVHWDKSLVNLALEFEVLADGTTILRGVVPDEAAKKRAVDLTSSTFGVTKVVDELVLMKDVKVIETVPPQPVKVIVPTDRPVIIKP